MGRSALQDEEAQREVLTKCLMEEPTTMRTLAEPMLLPTTKMIALGSCVPKALAETTSSKTEGST